MCERSHELTESVGRQSAVDPAIALGEVCVVVIRCQQHLKSPGPTQKAREALDCTSARDLANAGSN